MFQWNKEQFTYHSILGDGWNNISNNEDYDLKGMVVDKMMNETIIKIVWVRLVVWKCTHQKDCISQIIKNSLTTILLKMVPTVD